MKIDTYVLTHFNAFMKVIELSKKYPNDMEFGKEVRATIIETNKSIEPFDNNIDYTKPKKQIKKRKTNGKK